MAEFQAKTWVDGSGGGTPITAAELNRMESGIARAVLPASSPPVSANAKDDEFDGASSVTWTDTTTAAAGKYLNATDTPGYAVLVGTSSGAAFQGIHQPVPGSYPYTITTRVVDHNGWQNYALSGLFLSTASPTGTSALLHWGWAYNNGLRVDRWLGQMNGTFTNETDRPMVRDTPMFFRMVVNSATSVDLLYSGNGKAWLTHVAAYNPGFTPGVMGIAVCSAGNAWPNHAMFEFFRVT